MLYEPPPPPALQLALNRRLATFLKPGDPTSSDAQRALRPAQQVFSLGLDKLSGGQPLLDSAVPVSWRFLIGARSGDGLYATVSRNDGEAAELTGMSRGPQASVALQASQDVKKLREAKAADYDLRILAIPGLLTECFWLKWTSNDRKTSDPEQDLIVPFVTAQKDLEPMHPYPVAEFLRIAANLATTRLDAFRRQKEEEAERAERRLATAKKKRVAWRAKLQPPPESSSSGGTKT